MIDLDLRGGISCGRLRGGSSPRLTLSDNVSVPVNVVWQRKSGADTWLYGMAVDDEHRPAWRELVDTLSS